MENYNTEMANMEDYTDYDVDGLIRQTAAQLGISGFHPKSGKSAKDLFVEIESCCPQAAEIILTQVFEKDKLNVYLEYAPNVVHRDGSIFIEDSEEFKAFWKKISDLYPKLQSAVAACR